MGERGRGVEGPSDSSRGGESQVSLGKGREFRESTQPDCKKVSLPWHHFL